MESDNRTALDHLQEAVSQFSRSRDPYEKQIRTDATFFVIPVMTMLTGLAAAVLWGFAPEPIIWPLPFIVVGGSVVTARYCWLLLKRRGDAAIEQAGLVYCTVHIIFVTMAFVDLWPHAQIIPYLFCIIIVASGHVIYPQAGFYTWVLSVLAMYIGLWLQGETAETHFGLLFSPIVIGFIFAILVYFVMQDWVTAVVSASRSHLLASSQRDKLFELTTALEKAHDRQVGLYAELDTIADVGRQMVSLLDLDALLKLMTREIHNQMGYAYVSIFLVKQNSEQLLLLADAESEHLKARHPTIYPVSINANHIIAQAAKQKKMLLADQISESDYPSHPYQRPYAFSEIVFPLLVGSDLQGVLNIQSTSATPFGKDSLKNLQTLANQAAIAIYNAQLYQEILLRHQLMTTLNDISRAISGKVDIDDILDLILTSLNELVSCNRTAVLLLEGDTLQIVAHRGFPDESDPSSVEIRLRRHGDAFNMIRETMDPLVIDDAKVHPTWQNVAGLTQTRSWLGAPLIENNQVIGMLSMTREKVRPFTDEEVELTMSFASQASVALKNGQAFAEVTRARAEAERANRLKGDFISNMSHEFKTPLNGIINMTGFVMDGVLGEVNEKQQNALQQTVDSGHHLLSMVNDILDITKFEAGMMSIPFTDVDLVALLQEMERMVVGLVKGRNIEIKADYSEQLPNIEGSRRRVRQILLNLVSNAVKYTPEGCITMKANLTDDGLVQISVSDTGIGIPDEDKEFVFESFGQAQNNKDNPLSTGLGLPIAKQLVDLHNGRIWFDSVVDVGSTFYVCLPVKQQQTSVMASD